MLERPLRRKLVMMLVAAAVGGGAALANGCGNEADGVTPTCGAPFDYNIPDASPDATPDGDSNCYTAPGSAATITTGSGGTSSSGGNGGSN